MAKLTTGSKTVTAAGTRERLVAVASNVSAKAVSIIAKESNTGLVYVGDDTIASTNSPDLNPGDAVQVNAEEPFNLSDIYLDVSVNGEGVDYCAVS